MKNCILIGVAGGSGSGKTTVANNLVLLKLKMLLYLNKMHIIEN